MTEPIKSAKCPNCRAVVPELLGTVGSKQYCCIHCAFNPLGCRCKWGEFGKPETALLKSSSEGWLPGDT